MELNCSWCNVCRDCWYKVWSCWVCLNGLVMGVRILKGLLYCLLFINCMEWWRSWFKGVVRVWLFMLIGLFMCCSGLVWFVRFCCIGRCSWCEICFCFGISKGVRCLGCWFSLVDFCVRCLLKDLWVEVKWK